jgi:Arc/MetJ-type ribon-helix-helix transcriptional regulator
MSSNEKKQISVRLEKNIHKTIETRVKSGEFDSNGDFVRKAIDFYLNQELLFEKLDTMQRNLMASQLDVVAVATGMTNEEKTFAAESLNEIYQDEVFH